MLVSISTTFSVTNFTKRGFSSQVNAATPTTGLSSCCEKNDCTNNSKKVTTIKNEKIFITTLKILDDNEKLKLFIENYCKNTQGKEDMPDWISDMNFFNDEQLKKDKDNNLAKISEIKQKNIAIDKIY